LRKSSEDLLETCWKKEGNFFSVIPLDSFIEVKWADLPTTPYAVNGNQIGAPSQNSYSSATNE
jgi:hypothetical protein